MRFVEQKVGVLLTGEFDHDDQLRYVKEYMMVDEQLGILYLSLSVCLWEDVAY